MNRNNLLEFIMQNEINVFIYQNTLSWKETET